MATSRRAAVQHEDWLNLAEPQAPWFALPVVKRVFPEGLDRTPPEVRAELVDRWNETRDGENRAGFVNWLLRDVLRWRTGWRAGPELPAHVAAGVTRNGVTVAPTGVYVPSPAAPVGLFGDAPTAGHDPDSSDPLVLVFVLDAEDIPTERPRGDLWSAKWMQRAALACRHLNVPLALVTNGDHLTLVHARADEATGWGTWRASLMSAEPLLLDSFVSMLGARRFAGVPPADTPAALLQESAGTEAEVTGQLGSQVRRAVELLVNAISRADRGVDGALLRDIAAEEVYEAAVTVMMRLVFLLVAEEKELLPVDDNTYRDLYSVRTLRESLERARGEDPEALENSSAAWHRLLATNRAVHAGVRHQALCVRAYGSTLFDPDRFGFLEGRAPGESWRTVSTTPISVTDLDVLAMLDALLILRFRSAAGVTDTRRLSYRNVSVEQIGHIYERLLDHGARRADSVVLGCKGASDNEPEIPLADLEAERINGDEALIAFLTDERANGGHYVGTPRQVAKLLADPVDGQLRAELRAACGGDETLVRRIEPFVNLLRTDLRDRPVVFLPGAVYVTETGRNRDSGTAYTTRELADELVEHALAPLCYSPGPRDTADTAEWRIRPSQEILGLRVCDPAVGSGAILVAACRYLADRLVEAQQGEDDPRAADLATAADDPSRHRAVVEATRLVAERCCYGVDRNPMAVEMAKLSMWLTTVAKDRPFTFLDHRFATGDSLLGIWDIEQLRWLHFDPDVGRTQTMSFAGYADGRDATARLQELLDEVLSLRQRMQDIPSESIADIDRKAALHRQAENLMPVIRATADLVTGAALATAGERNASAALTNLLASDLGLLGNLLTSIGTEHQIVALASVQRRAHQRLNVSRPDMAPERRPLHWPIAFPEVFAEGQRFDAMVANPPFIGGQKISGAAGDDYRNYCVAWMAEGKRGSADLVAYFFLNATRVARSLGYLATNTIAQGDTSEVGLEQVIDRGWTIHRAVSSVQWPGEPTVEIAKLWIDQSEWSCRRILDGRSVVVIDEMLYPGSRIRWRKKRLLENSDKSFMGSTVLGIGFTIEPDHALSLIDHDPGNYDVLYPYLNGKDLNTSPSQEASRWIINFFDWPESRAREYVECFAIIEERVRPTRMTNPNAAARIWWRYWRPAPRLYQAITNLDRVIVVACVSKTVMPMFVAARQVFAHALIVFAYDNYFHLGLLSSSFHYRWVVRYGSTLETRTRYTPSDVFETFPQPVFSEEVAAAAEALDDHRREQLYARMIGVTTLYNRVHDPSDHDRDVRKLRELHVELDRAVGAAYGWRDLQFKHGFHDIRGAGRRFTLAPETADEVLTRLLELNRERYLAERQIASHRPNGLGGRERLTASSFALFGQDDEEH